MLPPVEKLADDPKNRIALEIGRCRFDERRMLRARSYPARVVFRMFLARVDLDGRQRCIFLRFMVA